MTRATARPDATRNASPYLYGGEQAAVDQILASGHYGHGRATEDFEEGVARFLGVADTVAVSSGTAALHLALLAADLRPDSEVIVPSLTFCATIHAILAAGARPRFVDVHPHTLCITPEIVEAALTPATAAVVPVLFGGRAVDLTPLHGTLDRRGITVVEDAAHAFGSRCGTRWVGSTGELTCFSFGPIKNITCGQGGMIVPRTPAEAARLRGLRSLGVPASADRRAAATTYEVTTVGFRAHMSTLNAAIGTVQLAHFAVAESTRKHLWRQYEAALKPMQGVDLVDVDVDNSVPHLAVVKVQDRDRVWEFMHARGIGVGVHYPPNHTQPAFRPWHRPLPATERLGEEIMTLPFHQHLGPEDIHRVVDTLQQALAAAGAGR
ncbi:DegT/DnrJ/EryC1/StrS aminotransferase family protein (plasmid) [Streptomyces sp. Q6]|uniref:DegT/DnrJ/EryC1/StrS aminotransferase family protein n=1 Tax=Streptomyces citrinus TaxID=3118173 RepID=A0ACD5AQW9_9ACTN